MQGERVVLQPLAVTLAEQMDGSFGGGYEKAVMWNEFDGIKKLTDGKYHFVRQARVGAEGEQAARGGAGLWDFAMQVLFCLLLCVCVCVCVVCLCVALNSRPYARDMASMRPPRPALRQPRLLRPDLRPKSRRRRRRRRRKEEGLFRG